MKNIITVLSLAVGVVIGLLTLSFPLPALLPAESASPPKPEIFNLKFDSFHLAQDPVSKAEQWFFNKIEETSGGRVKITPYWAGVLSPAGEQLDAVRSGRVELAVHGPGYTPAETPILCGMDQGYSSRTPDAKAKAMRDLYQEFDIFRAEMDRSNVVPVAFLPFQDLATWSAVPIPDLASIRGKKLRVYGVLADTIPRLGGVPVNLPVGESYEAVQRKIVDAATGMGLAHGMAYRMYEVAPYLVHIGYGQYASAPIFMNRDVWKKLPEDIQRIFLAWAEPLVDYYCKIMSELDCRAIDDLVARGQKIQIWSDEDVKTARSLTQPAQRDEWVNKMISMGLDSIETKALMDRYFELLDKYNKESVYLSGYDYYRMVYAK